MKYILLLFTGMLLISTAGYAGEADVVEVDIKKTGGDTYFFKVTVKHADEGWDHYANKWDVVAPDDTVLGTRTLYHPHENEQPFTRSLGGVAVPADTGTVYVEAHDKVHGWSPQRVQVDLSKSNGERFEVSR